MGRKNKVKKNGWTCESAVMSLHAQGKSLRDIADEVSERFNTDISHESVKNYLNNNKDERLARMTEENKGYLAQEKQELILEYGNKIEQMEDKLDTILEVTLDEQNKQDVGQILQVMKEVRKLMEFQKEYIEEATTPNTQINNVEVTNNTAIQLSEKLMEYEEKGVITIHEPNKLER
jgi:hypothetical protein